MARSRLAAGASPEPHPGNRLVEGRGALGGKDTGGTSSAVREGEAELGGKELLDVRAADVGSLLNLSNLEDVNRGETGTVTGSHVLVHGLDSLGAGQRTVLLVHVVGTGSRVVSEPDTKVLDLERPLLVDGVDGNDLTGGLLHLPELSNEVPEARLGNDGVLGEDPHPVELGSRLLLGGKVTADHHKLSEPGHLEEYWW